MLLAAAVFAVVAAVDERWGLLAAMVVLAFAAVGLLGFHWWLIYRFGATQGGRES